MFLFLSTIFALVVFVSGDCGVVTKKEWGGITPKHVEYLPRPVSLVIIQHTVTHSCKTDAECADIVRSIQDNHMIDLGWSDIGPSFLIGGNGKVYEGAGWLHIGAHTYGYNSRSIGITFIGNYNNDQASNEVLQVAKDFIECGVKNGHLKSDYYLVGHRQLIATESPGRYLFNEIRSWPHYLDDKTKIKKN